MKQGIVGGGRGGGQGPSSQPQGFTMWTLHESTAKPLSVVPTTAMTLVDTYVVTVARMFPDDAAVQVRPCQMHRYSYLCFIRVDSTDFVCVIAILNSAPSAFTAIQRVRGTGGHPQGWRRCPGIPSQRYIRAHRRRRVILPRERVGQASAFPLCHGERLLAAGRRGYAFHRRATSQSDGRCSGWSIVLIEVNGLFETSFPTLQPSVLAVTSKFKALYALIFAVIPYSVWLHPPV